MRIGGFQKLTLVDFPGKVAATVFSQGCNFRCGYCHNAQLVLPRLFQAYIPEEEVLDYLYDRREKLQGIVISGGEPTLQKGLGVFMAQLKKMGFAVKLDTNGSHPEVLSSLLELKLIDYIAMDVKSSWPKYTEVTGTPCDTTKIRGSIDLIIKSGIPYQFRTTLVKKFCSQEDLEEIQRLIGSAENYVLQAFVFSRKMVDLRWDRQNQYTGTEVELLKSKYERSNAGGIQ